MPATPCLLKITESCSSVETLIARQWWWLGFIAIVSVVPAGLMFTPSAALVRHLLGALGLPAEAGYLVGLLPAMLATCAYAVARRIRRPLARARSRVDEARGSGRTFP